MLLTLLLISGTAFGTDIVTNAPVNTNTNAPITTIAPVIAPVDTNVNTFTPVNTDVNTNTNLNTNANTNLNTNANTNLNCNTASSNLLNVVGVGVCNDNDVKSNSKSDAKVNFSYVAPRDLLALPNAYGPGGLLAIPGEMIGDLRLSSLLPTFGGLWSDADITASGKTKSLIYVKEKFSDDAATVIPWVDTSALPAELKGYKALKYAGEIRTFIDVKKTEDVAPMYCVSDGIKASFKELGANLLVIAIVNEDVLKSKTLSGGIGAGGSGLPGPTSGASGTLGLSFSGGTGKTLVRAAALVIGYHYDEKKAGY